MNNMTLPLSLVLLTSTAFADPILWDGGGTDDLWNNPVNWVGDTLPQASDDAIVGAGFTANVNANNIGALNSVQVGGTIVGNSFNTGGTDVEILSTGSMLFESGNATPAFGAATLTFHSGATHKEGNDSAGGRLRFTEGAAFQFVFDASGFTNNSLWTSSFGDDSQFSWDVDVSAFSGAGTFDLITFDRPDLSWHFLDTQFSSTTFMANSRVVSYDYREEGGDAFVSVTLTAVPEPSTFALLGMALSALMFARRRMR